MSNEDDFDIELGDAIIQMDDDDDDEILGNYKGKGIDDGEPGEENHQKETEQMSDGECEEETQETEKIKSEQHSAESQTTIESPRSSNFSMNKQGVLSISTNESGNQCGNSCNNSVNEMEEDEMDKIMSQIDEEEIHKSTQMSASIPQINASRVNEMAGRIDHRRTVTTSEENSPPSKITSISELQKMSLQRISPGKINTMDPDTCSFFLTQAQPEGIGISPTKRSFPGPAGLLPDITKNKSWNFESIRPLDNIPRSPICDSPNKKFKSDAGDSLTLMGLSKAPWKMVLRQLNLNLNDETCLLHFLNLGWLKPKYKRQKIRIRPELASGDKIPFLAVVVKEPMVYHEHGQNMGMVTLTLMDPTGIIKAILSPTFIEAYKKLISPGTALVLRNCPVIVDMYDVYVFITKKVVMCLATDEASIIKVDDDDSDEVQVRTPTPACTNPPTSSHQLCLSENGVIYQQFVPFCFDSIHNDFMSLLSRLENRKRKDNKVKNFRNKAKRKEDNNLFTVIPNNANTNTAGEFCGGDSNFDDDEDDEQLFLQALQNFELLSNGDSENP